MKGGARPNAGRKDIKPEEKRVQVSISVAPLTKQRIQLLRKRHVKVGRLVDDLLDNIFEEEK